jgi:hypothetical protein
VKKVVVARLRRVLVSLYSERRNPSKIAVAISLGVIFGIIPFPFITTWILMILAFRLRLNMIVIQTVNYFVFPLQVALFIPFFKIANRVFHTPLISMELSEFVKILKASPLGFLSEIWKAQMGALIVWSIFSLVLFAVLFVVSKTTLKKYLVKQAIRVKPKS